MDDEVLGNDSSDEDYVPDAPDTQEPPPSEEDSDGDPEDDNDDGQQVRKGNSKRNASASGKRRGKNSKRVKLDDDDDDDDDDDISEPENVPVISEETRKMKTDSLWADFLKDTDTKPKSPPPVINSNDKVERSVNDPDSSRIERSASADKTVTITKVYEFAGEEVIVKKQVPVSNVCTTAGRGRIVPSSRGGGGGGGLSSVLGQLGKKEKISTLEKSKLDWDRFKQNENIEDELSAHNKGKQGYLERQDFLQRADQRQFELEKDLRTKQRSQRL